MAVYRRIRKHDKIRVTGPATFTVVGGRAAITIDAEPAVKIEHSKRQRTRRGLTIPKKMP